MIQDKQEVDKVQELWRHLWIRYLLELLTQGTDGDELALRRIVLTPVGARFEIFCHLEFIFVFRVDWWLYWPNEPSYFGDAPGFGQFILNDLIVRAEDGRMRQPVRKLYCYVSQ